MSHPVMTPHHDGGAIAIWTVGARLSDRNLFMRTTQQD